MTQLITPTELKRLVQEEDERREKEAKAQQAQLKQKVNQWIKYYIGEGWRGTDWKSLSADLYDTVAQDLLKSAGYDVRINDKTKDIEFKLAE